MESVCHVTRYHLVALQLWGKDISISATDTRVLDWVETETLTLQPYCKPVRPHIYALNIRNTGYGYNWRILEELASMG